MTKSWVSPSGNLLTELIQKKGHTFTFVTRNPKQYIDTPEGEKHIVFRNSTETIIVDTNDFDLLIEVVKDKKFDGIITICDYYVETLQKLAETLSIPCPFPKNVSDVKQKHLLRQLIDSCDLPNAHYHIVYTWDDACKVANEIVYPFVMKPVDLASSAFVRKINNFDELKYAFHQLGKFSKNFRDQVRNPAILFEEFLVGEEVSVESITYNREC